MGWCNGTKVFDDVVDVLIDEDVATKKIVGVLYNSLRDLDWDCVCESQFIDNPVVKEVIAADDPYFFEGWDE